MIAKKLNFYFVTVDPERDTAVLNMNEYLNNFNNQIIGVTGRPEKI